MITALDLRLIRELHHDGKISQSEIALRFDVSLSTINRICTGKRWRGVGGGKTGKSGYYVQISDRVRNGVVAMLREGYSITSIGKRYKIHTRTVRKIAADANIDYTPRRNKPLASDMVNDIVSAYRNGALVCDISSRFNVDPTTVRLYARANGLPART